METSNSQLDGDVAEEIIQSIKDGVCQVCSGSYNVDEVDRLVRSTISFPNKREDDVNGKPHNVEIRIALKLFHQTRKRKRETPYIELTSDMGLTRCIQSPFELAQILCQVLNQEWDVRVNASGILCLVTPLRSQLLRLHGRLPCPSCITWCKGEKGLWWHQQQAHGVDHAAATERAASERSTLAMVPYNPQQVFCTTGGQVLKNVCRPALATDEDNVFEFARQGNLDALQNLARGLNLADMWDRKGASPLHWAAGSGQLAVVQYLIQECNCNVDVGQRGKRSFSGRTALHWAARNGHLEVVQYLVEDCRADMDATTIDGTSAFGWACWQGHLQIMKYLHRNDCDIHKTNTFGCNAVLWCAQGEGNRLEAIQWLHDAGCEMSLVNSNGHGALHKAAQRGRADLVEWLVDNVSEIDFAWIGPDADGCCPSDLAGMEGHCELAEKLVASEALLATQLYHKNTGALPEWLKCASGDDGKYASNIWEAWGGTRRLCKHLSHYFQC